MTVSIFFAPVVEAPTSAAFKFRMLNKNTRIHNVNIDIRSIFQEKKVSVGRLEISNAKMRSYPAESG